MKTQNEHTDRRIKRSQRQLKQAFMELMREKGFPSITIQDITDRADVNRGTFYAHFPDKYALLEAAIREKFQRLLEAKLPSDAGWEQAHLRILIHTVLEHFKEMSGRCYPIDTVNPLFERAVQEELYTLLLHWLQQSRPDSKGWGFPVETLALMTSWAIFGAAADWSRGKSQFSTEQMTDHVMSVLTEGTIKLLND
ncbi:AcrR family transcriptional regulator [Paenibacillus forsythiae]|uniref:AcrR family transcriptional regulator n=1 Tax=Paenibacillus forsythiae TaxID=365616 RepID=A0ABU3H4Z1_9BACL|nr:TetR/AcrR family transcriptional regulator [Paenibacillus forsythiae]MDT3425890.1 AcrR family transcriptional regulator [Paenibacillus forsythiae]